jgi:four helix bundle protein
MVEVGSKKFGDMGPRRDLAERTKQFALRIIRLTSKLPRTDAARVIGRQLLRSGTSIGANYREAARSSTKKHFTSILVTALREADETLYWLELLSESETVKPDLLADLIDESQQLVAILSASVKTARS